MKQLEKIIREELLTASEGTCLSIFVPEGSVKERCDNLKELIVEASNYLRTIYNAGEMEDFLRPIARLGKDDVSHFKGAFAVFRTMDSFRLMGVPIEIQKECVVSNHFHVKPLLQWLQQDREFFCIDFSKSSVDVLRGDATSFKSVGCYGIGPRDVELIDNCVSDNSEDHKETLVFLSGDNELAHEFLDKTRLLTVENSVIERSAYHGDYERLWEALNDRVRHRSVLKVKRSLLDYNLALMNGNGRSDLEEIINAAKEGNIRKLIVSQDEKIWGRFDAYKNHANRVNKQINYEDDDLLDSISEKVMKTGGEVVLASNKQMPKGKRLLAILKKAA